MELNTYIKSKKSPDFVLLAIVFALSGFGLAMCYSASAVYAMSTFGDAFYFFKRQLVWFFAGIVILLTVQAIDYRIYKRYTRPMLIVSFVLLLLVLFPGLGHHVKGASRWINFGFFSVQPSEFVKVVIVIYLVKIFSRDRDGNKPGNTVVQLLFPLFIVATMFVLIMLQPDFSTAMTLLFVAAVIFFMSGFPFIYMITLFILSIPMFYLLIYQVDYRRERILAYLDPWKDRFGNGYHIIQSFIAFKKGGLLGLGMGFGEQKIRRLPEPHTDFIFAVIAEEMGLFGTGLIVILFCFFFVRITSIALAAPDNFGSFLAIGLGVLIVAQAFINIGVVTGGLPTTGIPLPFLSYGGSSFLSCMLSVGILLNISRYGVEKNRMEKTTKSAAAQEVLM
ncbi:MAG: putative lipid II flippase FtsW [Leptospirales bacterium]|nr:putative lipid II flippase FtsW [Leptospirales bacterium]